MSFGGQNVSKVTLKNFESQGEIDEKKRQRQEEWEKVRKADDPLECPEEEKRSLFEQLQAAKDAKEQEYEDEHRLRNSVKGLEEDEVGFLNFVSKRQMEIEKERKSEEDSVLREMREAAVTITSAATSKPDVKEKSPSRPSCSGASRKSQQSLLCGAVKRKRSASPDRKQKDRPSEEEKEEKEESETTECTNSSSSQSKGVARVIGILPGIGEYSGASSDTTSSSESDLEDFFPQKTVIRKVHVVESNH
ncbi:PSME3-interacting protein-like isoform X1 [Gigantopelta aegis]|uniref:PSME3-interacting protein-like isoform X1 n=1 Tax=Gigantopelta aegis TaxID=1735272 RepID=UPI001B8896B3|nr:PSME3-interacting protein-like isoform X1 [Gigantopelta aegis]XP_041375387.1 PSME3-interacting protein-like isoform X1 [Gigantopelta aegis]XP_041375388.1 PSME3-interacting protein-like isoform X1 [Gigantopelta aegis]